MEKDGEQYEYVLDSEDEQVASENGDPDHVDGPLIDWNGVVQPPPSLNYSDDDKSTEVFSIYVSSPNKKFNCSKI